jgi:hypothetical protein
MKTRPDHADSSASWEADFAVGIPLIDAQHQALLALCNRAGRPVPGSISRDE